MHMADALVSPPVAGAMWAASAATIAYSSRKVRQDLDERKVPLMGVLGAFIFAAQMINFTIPGTGSSGHLGGGLLLAVLLGPHAAFLTIASVLIVQALFFADGGLLALGCNIMNLGFVPAFICYPLFYRPLSGRNPGMVRLWTASVVTAIVAMQIGALGVVAETTASGIAQLPLGTFLAVMLAIHLAIGVVEGGVTAALIAFIRKARPDLLHGIVPEGAARPVRVILAAFLIAALLAGGVASRFASESPDGLEWSLQRVTGRPESVSPGGRLHALMKDLQARIAPFPDYVPKGERPGENGNKDDTSVSGVVGGVMTCAVLLSFGFLLKAARRWTQREGKRTTGNE